MIREIKLLNTTDTILLVIDAQEKLLQSIRNKNELIWNIRKLTRACQLLNIEIIYSEQNPGKLGKTLDDLKVNNYNFYSKMAFSCCNCLQLVDFIKSKKATNILICGVESHVCVQQTSIDLMSIGFQPHVAVDAISSRKLIDHEVAIRKLDSLGVNICTSESAIFELCRTAQRPEFKEISSLIKENPKGIDL